MAAIQPVVLALTKYVELFKNEGLAGPSQPFGPGYDVLFDQVLDVEGWKEIRVWVHVFVNNYAATPVTNAAHLKLRFMHHFAGGQFDYEHADLPWNHVTSYIDGYASRPLIGTKLRLLCEPISLPAGPYSLDVTCLLVR
jgi:hypothetical protein